MLSLSTLQSKPPFVPLQLPQRPLLCNIVENKPFLMSVWRHYSQQLALRALDFVRLLSVGISTIVRDLRKRMGLLRTSESTPEGDTSRHSIVESDCTMSSLLLPIS